MGLPHWMCRTRRGHIGKSPPLFVRAACPVMTAHKHGNELIVTHSVQKMWKCPSYTFWN